MLEFIIEGLLMQNEMSGYDINLQMKDTQLFKASFGNIYPTLKRLEASGSIGSRDVVEAGKYKKIYSIKEKGKKEFLEWLEQPIDIRKWNNEHSIRMYFYSYLPKEKAKALISEFIGKMHSIIRSLEVYESKLKNHINFFQLAVFRLWIDYCRFLVDWYQKFLDGLDEEKQ
jgi:DNA-binding PadR family transcriptional regulator